MGKRYEPRAQTRLAVRVSGVDLHGNPFKQTAYAYNISRRGACLDGVGCLRGPGETIEIKHGSKKARFFVVWVGIPGTPEHHRMGVRNLDRNQDIWKLNLPKHEPDSFEVPIVDSTPEVQWSAPPKPIEDQQDEKLPTPAPPEQERTESWPAQDRRRYRRYAVEGSATFQVKGTDARTWGKLSDVSPGGCYVESYVPFPAGTELEMTLEVSDSRISAEGFVKVVYPGLGMGIELTKIASDSQAALEKITTPRWR